MKPKSKSKTFPKGTDRDKMIVWVVDQVYAPLTEGRDYAYHAIKDKVLITVTKYDTDKEEDKG